MPPARKRLGELLVEAGVLDAMQLQAALGIQRQWGGKLGSVLVERKFIAEPKLVATLARQLNVPVVQIAKANVDGRALSLVPAALCAQLHVFPLELKGPERTETLVVAMSDPTDLSAIDQLQFRTRKRIQSVLAGDKDISSAIRRHYYHEDAPPPADSMPSATPKADAGSKDAHFKDAHLLGTSGDDEHVPGLVAWGGAEVRAGVPTAPAGAVATPFAPLPFAGQPVPGFGAPSPFLQSPPMMPPAPRPPNPGGPPPMMGFGAVGSRGPTGTPVAVPIVPSLMAPRPVPAEPRGTPSQPVPLPARTSDIDPFAELDEPPTIAAPARPAFQSVAPSPGPVAPLPWGKAEPEQAPADDNSWIEPVSAPLHDNDPLGGNTGLPAGDSIDLEAVDEAATIVPASAWTPDGNDEIVDAAGEGWLTPATDEDPALSNDASLETPSESSLPPEEDSWDAPSEGELGATPVEPVSAPDWESGATQPISMAPMNDGGTGSDWYDQNREPNAEPHAWVEAAGATVATQETEGALEAVPLDTAVPDAPMTLESGWEAAAAQSWTASAPEGTEAIETPLEVATDDTEVAAEDIEEIEEAQIEEENTARNATTTAAEPAEAPEVAAAEADGAWSEPAPVEAVAEAAAVEEAVVEEAAPIEAAVEEAAPIEAVVEEAAPIEAAVEEAAPSVEGAQEWAGAEVSEPAAEETPLEEAPVEDAPVAEAAEWATAPEPEAEPVEEAPVSGDAAFWAATSEPVASPEEPAIADPVAAEATEWATTEASEESSTSEVAAGPDASAETATDATDVAVDYSSSDTWAGFSTQRETRATDGIALGPVSSEDVAHDEVTPVGPVSGSGGMLGPDEAGLVEDQSAQLRPEEAAALAETEAQYADAPAEEHAEVAAEEAAVEQAAVEEIVAAAEEAPVEAVEAVAEEAPLEAAAEEAPLEAAAEEAPLEAAAEETPLEAAAEEAPLEAAAEETPLEAAAEEAPLEAAPEEAPLEEASAEPVAEEVYAEEQPAAEVVGPRGWHFVGIENPTSDDAVVVVGALLDVLVSRGTLTPEELVEAIRLVRETPQG